MLPAAPLERREREEGKRKATEREREAAGAVRGCRRRRVGVTPKTPINLNSFILHKQGRNALYGKKRNRLLAHEAPASENGFA